MPEQDSPNAEPTVSVEPAAEPSLPAPQEPEPAAPAAQGSAPAEAAPAPATAAEPAPAPAPVIPDPKAQAEALAGTIEDIRDQIAANAFAMGEAQKTVDELKSAHDTLIVKYTAARAQLDGLLALPQ